MKRIALTFCIALAFGAATAQATDRAQIGYGARQAVVETLSTLLTKGAEPAPTSVRRCVWTNPRAGRCSVVVKGTVTCHVTAHVRAAADSYVVWASRVDCR